MLITSNDVSRSAVADDLIDTFDCMRPLIGQGRGGHRGHSRHRSRAGTLLLRLGAEVAINGRDAVLVEEVVQQAESPAGTLIGLAGDIANADHRSELVQFAGSQPRSIDVLVNNAAVIAEAPLSTMTTNRWRYVLRDQSRRGLRAEVEQVATPCCRRRPVRSSTSHRW
ncbi:MAG: SDR family oxidoreductase [Solirubrobacteraceae bacterium]